MGLKIEAGCGIQRKLEAGCGMKSSSRDRDTQFFTVGMWDVLKSMAGFFSFLIKEIFYLQNK